MNKTNSNNKIRSKLNKKVGKWLAKMFLVQKTIFNNNNNLMNNINPLLYKIKENNFQFKKKIIFKQ